MPLRFTDRDTRNRVRFATHASPECLDPSFQADFSFRDRGSHLSFLKNDGSAPGPDQLYPWVDIDTRAIAAKLLGLELRLPDLPGADPAPLYSSANHYRSHIDEFFAPTLLEPIPPLEGRCTLHMAATDLLEIRYTLRATGPGPVNLALRFHTRAAAPFVPALDGPDLILHGEHHVRHAVLLNLRLWATDTAVHFHLDPSAADHAHSDWLPRTVQPGKPLQVTFRCVVARSPVPPPRRDEPGHDLAATIAEHEAAYARLPDLPAEHRPFHALVSTAAGTLRTLRYHDLTPGGERVMSIHAGKCGVAATWWWDTAFAMLGLAVMGETETFSGAARVLTEAVPDTGQPCTNVLGGMPSGGGQNPCLAWGIGHFLRRHPDDALLARLYPPLKRYLHWWLDRGVPDYDGLCPYHQRGVCWDDALRWHTGHPLGVTVPWYSEKPGHGRADLFLSADVNTHLYLDVASLARAARRLGLDADAAALQAHADRLAVAINTHLVDPDTDCYQDRDLRNGRFSGMLTPACFMPIYAGIAPRDRAQRLCRDLLLDPERFYTALPFPTLDRSHPCFRAAGPLSAVPQHPGSLVQEAYWIGRTWPHLSYWMVGALHQAGLHVEADAAAERILDAMSRHTTIAEVYDSLTGDPTGHPEFMWSAAAVLALAQRLYTQDPVGF